MARIGTDDPYAHVDRCDHVTDDGRCRLALERSVADPTFLDERADADDVCIVSEEASTWADCPHFRSTTDGRACRRCGLERRPDHADSARQPLVEEHHLSYADEGHEITVTLCRWCHAKVHESWARITEDVAPDPDAIAERERRRGQELEEARFRTAADRFDSDG